METKKSSFSRLDELEGAQESIPQLPMKWHYVYCFVVLPVCAVVSGVFAVAAMAGLDIADSSSLDINPFQLMHFLLYAGFAIFAIVTIFCLMKKQRNAPKKAKLFHLLNVVIFVFLFLSAPYSVLFFLPFAAFHFILLLVTNKYYSNRSEYFSVD